MTPLESRILDISRKHKLSHLSSNLSAVGIIDEIYTNKSKEDLFVLSKGHAGLALYVVLEKHLGINAEELLKENGIHPKKSEHIFCSAGSLGQGITLALGAALATPNRHVYCLISDGEFYEGSTLESIVFLSENPMRNFHLYIDCNGFSAYKHTSPEIIKMFTSLIDAQIIDTSSIYRKFSFLNGLDGHYCTL